jgi:hypothetical protein
MEKRIEELEAEIVRLRDENKRMRSALQRIVKRSRWNEAARITAEMALKPKRE